MLYLLKAISKVVELLTGLFSHLDSIKYTWMVLLASTVQALVLE